MLASKYTFLIVIFAVVNGGPVPITPCKGTDNECILKSSREAKPYFVKGIPEVGVPPAEPIALKDYSTVFGDLSVSLTNILVKDIPKAEILNVERNVDKSELIISITSPISVYGKYKGSGKFIDIDVEGDGEIELNSEKVSVTITVQLEEFFKNEEKYYHVTHLDYDYKFDERLNIKLTNLYGGDKEKGDALLKILNDSWEVLVSGIGEPVIKDLINTIVYGNINPFFENVPAKELELA